MAIRLPAVSAVIASTVLIATASCAAIQPTELPNERARLDIDNHLVLTPLDSFAPTVQELSDIEYANALLIQHCMSEHGLHYPRAEQDWESRPVMPDRQFGLWSMDHASNYGYDLAPFPSGDAADEAEAQFPELWWTTWLGCVSSVEQLPLMLPFSSGHETVLDRAVRETFRSAESSSTWTEARGQWASCMERRGVVVGEGRGFVPQAPSGSQASIEIAVIDVECKLSLGIAQRLGDLIAAYERIYVDANAAELNEFRRQVDSVVREARDVITQNR